MVATLIVILIITLLAIFILPFFRALMKDREELHSNPLEKKFQILVARLNDTMMGGYGEITTFKDDPRMLNMLDENMPNMMITFYYSTGHLTIRLGYKHYNVELIKEMKFYNMRDADSFRQQDVANHFYEEAKIAIDAHREKVNAQMGFKDNTGNYSFKNTPAPENSNNPIDIIRSMYNEYTHEQKLALANAARIIFTADGSSDNEFLKHGQCSSVLLSLQVNFSEVKSFDLSKGKTGTINALRNVTADMITMAMTILPFVFNKNNEPVPARENMFYTIFESLGYSPADVNEQISKAIMLTQQFGVPRR